MTGGLDDFTTGRAGYSLGGGEAGVGQEGIITVQQVPSGWLLFQINILDYPNEAAGSIVFFDLKIIKRDFARVSGADKHRHEGDYIGIVERERRTFVPSPTRRAGRDGRVFPNGSRRSVRVIRKHQRTGVAVTHIAVAIVAAIAQIECSWFLPMVKDLTN